VLFRSGGGQLRARAGWEHAAGRGLVAVLEAQALDLRWLAPLLPRMRELGGRLDANLRLSATADGASALTGRLALAGGRIGIVGLRTIEDVGAEVTLGPDGLHLQRLHARAGGGTLDATGQARLERLLPVWFGINIQASQFLLSYGGSLRARLDGDFNLTGGMRGTAFHADLRIARGQIELPAVATGNRRLQPLGPLADVTFVDPSGRAQAARERERAQRRTLVPVGGPVRDVDASISVPERLHVHGSDIDTHVVGSLAVHIDPDGESSAVGQLDARGGFVEVYGQRFDIARARFVWNEDPLGNPQLDMRLTRVLADATVMIELRGAARHPEITLVSDPPIYDQAQLVAMVLSGDSSGSAISPAGTISAVLLGRITSQLAPGLPVDVLRIERAQEPIIPGSLSSVTETRVEVGKRLTGRIYLSYVHLFGAPENANSNEAHIEYQISRRWLLQTAFGDAGIGGADVFWTYRY